MRRGNRTERCDVFSYQMGEIRAHRLRASRGSSDDEEFQRFVKACLPKLLRSAYALQGDLDIAEDVVQGTLLRVFRHWHTARDAPEGYAYATLVNICHDEWRRRRRHPEQAPVGDALPLGGSVLPGEQWEQHETLEQALIQLPYQQHAVLLLRYFFDLSTADTARALGIPEGTVKSTTYRGLERLRGLLEATPEEAEHVDR